MKKFNNWRHADGFTLVELIVVIAILAILGGVAIPAYSGYVTKAEQAADEALLAEVNMAFASACALNGKDHFNRNDVANQVLNEGVLNYTGAEKEYFDNFYEGGKFQTVSALIYEGTLGGFQFGYSYDGGYVLSKADRDKILGSNFGKLSSDEVVDMLEGTLDYVSGDGNTYLSSVSDTKDFKDMVQQVFGKSYDKCLEEYVYQKAGEAYDAENGAGKWAALGENGQLNYVERNDLTTQYASDANANMAILVAAQGTQAQKDYVVNALKTDPAAAKAEIQKALLGTTGATSTPTEGLSQAALVYGMYASYQISQGKDASELNPSQAWKDIADPTFNAGFQAYLEKPEADTDLAGFMASMNTISNQDSSTANNVLQNGISDENLQEALKEILGK